MEFTKDSYDIIFEALKDMLSWLDVAKDKSQIELITKAMEEIKMVGYSIEETHAGRRGERSGECQNCGNSGDTSLYMVNGDDIELCVNCVEDEYSLCDHCNERFVNDDLSTCTDYYGEEVELCSDCESEL